MIANLIQEGVTLEMIERTNNKFKAWDRIVKENILEKGTEQEIAEAYSLLQDVTVFAYAFFRIPGTKKPLKLFPYQDMVLNDDYDRIMFVAANQIGKSYALSVKAIHYAYLHPGHTVLMTSKTLVQAKDLLRQIKVILQSGTLDYKADIGDVENKSEIQFRHYDEIDGKQVELPYSRIVVGPAGEGILGVAANLILADEIAFYEDANHFYYQILQPRTYATKGKIILFSNPNGSSNLYHELWQGEAFHKYRFRFLDNPNNTQKEYDRLCKSLTRAQRESTLDAEFTSAEGGFFSPEEIRLMQEQRESFVPTGIPEQLYIAFDFAKTRDNTIRAIAVERNNGVYVYELKQYPNNTPYNDIIDELIDLIKEVGPEHFACVGFDAGGPGKAIEDWIKKVEEFGVQSIPIDFTLQKKNSMYTLFKLLAERNVRGEFGIKMPYTSYGDHQLKALTFKTTAAGKLTIHHENESDKDDVPDVCALLCSLIVNPESPPITLEIVDNKKGQFKKVDDTIRCECGNILDIYDEKCSHCDKKMETFI